MSCNRSKPGACRHLSFATNPGESYKKIMFFIPFDILVPNYSEGGYCLNEINFILP